MKNVIHPNMFPVGAGAGTAAALASEAPVATDADVGGIASTPSPADPWANPISALQKRADKPYIPAGKTRADQAITYLRENGPCDGATLCKALGVNSHGGISPFIAKALKDGRIVRADGKYAVGGEAPADSVAAPALTAAPVTVAAETKSELPAIAHFEAATAIVARKPKAQRRPSPAPSAAADPEPAKPTGRKPEFVVFVGDVQLLSWPEGDITIQTDSSAIELKPVHFRALMTLVELRK